MTQEQNKMLFLLSMLYSQVLAHRTSAQQDSHLYDIINRNIKSIEKQIKKLED